MMTVLKILLEMTVMASVMIGIVLVIRMGMSRKMNPTVMLLLWIMILVRLCLPITFTSPVHISDLIPEQAVIEQVGDEIQPGVAPELPESFPAQTSGTAVDISRSQTEKSAIPRIGAQISLFSQIDEFFKSIPIWGAVICIWALGVLFILLITIRRAALFRRKLYICKPIADDKILQIILQHKQNTGIKKDIKVLECNCLPAPAVFGHFKPCILLPTLFIKSVDISSMRGILLHEIYHIKRHDILINYIWLVAKALHWFNPLVWMAYKLFQDDVELCCDQMVVSNLGEDDRLKYSQSLVEAARFSRQNYWNPVPVITTALNENKFKLKERVIRLIKPQKKSRVFVMVSVLLAMFMFIVCFTTVCQLTPDKAEAVGETEEETAPLDEAEKEDLEEETVEEENVEEKTSGILNESKIVYSSGRDGNWEIYVMDSDGKNQVRLTDNDSSDVNPCWSPDGSKIAFESDRDGNWEIYVMDSDGKNQVRLTDNDSEDAYPFWSPDGSKIAFESDRDGNWEIYIMDSDGKNQVVLTTGKNSMDGFPSWCPDGSMITYSSDRDGNWEIYVMDSDGKNQVRFTDNDSSDLNPYWSSNKSKIAFESDRDGNWEIYIMDSDGKNQVRLTDNDSSDVNPCWSPDGSKIAFESDRDGNWEIYVMDFDGKNQVRLTDNDSSEANPSWFQK
ncbi:MAG: M56 family metallopeptidase [Actinomycetota bacterium]